MAEFIIEQVSKALNRCVFSDLFVCCDRLLTNILKNHLIKETYKIMHTINRKLIHNKIPQLLFKREVSNDMCAFKQALSASKEVVILSGAGISAESGIPTFRGQEVIWRNLPPTVLFSSSTFRDDPGFVWEFFHYTREMVAKAKPNAGHIAIAEYEARHTDKHVTVLTQNIDELHVKAGSKNVIELHGSLFKTRCTKCGEIQINTDSPICEALRGTGSPESKKLSSKVKEQDLPHCKKPHCGALLRPHIVFFGETMEQATVDAVEPYTRKCNMLLVVGTSSLVYPAGAYATVMQAAGALVAEFNIKPAPASDMFEYYFRGRAGTLLPQALSD